MNYKVSVVVPVYNVEEYLHSCIESLFGQSYKNIEIILVDDESPDNCPRLCDEYAVAHENIKVLHKKNGGLGYARNSGLEIATGDFVEFLDSAKFFAQIFVRFVYFYEICIMQLPLQRQQQQ